MMDALLTTQRVKEISVHRLKRNHKQSENALILQRNKVLIMSVCRMEMNVGLVILLDLRVEYLMPSATTYAMATMAIRVEVQIEIQFGTLRIIMAILLIALFAK